MKEIKFIGNSLSRIREFPEDIRSRTGFELHKVQVGLQPTDFKPMKTIGKGVLEIRLQDEAGIYRVIYTAKVGSYVYVLHAFTKKTQTTAKIDIDVAKSRFNELINEVKK